MSERELRMINPELVHAYKYMRKHVFSWAKPVTLIWSGMIIASLNIEQKH